MRSSSIVGVALTALPLVAAQTCFSGVKIFIARGTGEPQNSSTQEVVAKQILQTIPNSNATEVQYPANTNFFNSSQAGIANAQQQIYAYTSACPTSKVVLMGYSQGADVIGDAITGGDSSGISVGNLTNPAKPLCATAAQNVIAVVQFGDPGRNINIGQNADSEGPACNVSAANPRAGSQYSHIVPFSGRLQEWCASGDPVCCATGTNFNAHLSYFTTENIDAIASFVADKYNNAAFPVTGDYNATDCTPYEFTYVSPTPSTTTAVSTGTGVASTGVKPSGTGTGVASTGVKPSGTGKVTGTAPGTGVTTKTTGPVSTGTLKPAVPTSSGLAGRIGSEWNAVGALAAVGMLAAL